MKDYWLAKLISSVQKVDSRKRLQKSIYLLQFCKGFPLQFDYFLHYYGPYSSELAALIDQLKVAGIINETPEILPNAIRYSSSITPKGKGVLDSLEGAKDGPSIFNKIKSFIPQFERLNQTDTWVLELAATVAYYYEDNWTLAQNKTAKFKKVPVDNRWLKKAVKLAKDFKKSA